MNDHPSFTERTVKRKKNYVLLSLVFAILGMLGQTAAVLYGYDASMRVFRLKNPLGPAVGWGLFVLSVVLFSALITLKGSKAQPCTSSHLTAFFSSFGGGVMLAASLVVAIECRNATGALSTVSTALAFLSLPSAMYLLLQALPATPKRETLLTALGFFPVLWGIMALLRIYFDNTSAIGDPLRILLQCALIAVMLAFLGELKLRVGKTGEPLFFAAAGVALVLSSAAAISQVILKTVAHAAPTDELMLSLATFFLSLYLFVSMIRRSQAEETMSEETEES